MRGTRTSFTSNGVDLPLGGDRSVVLDKFGDGVGLWGTKTSFWGLGFLEFAVLGTSPFFKCGSNVPVSKSKSKGNRSWSGELWFSGPELKVGSKSSGVVNSVAGNSGLGNFVVLPKGASFKEPELVTIFVGERVDVSLNELDGGSVKDVAIRVETGKFESVDVPGVGLGEVEKFGESEGSVDTTVCSGLSFFSGFTETGILGLVRSGTSWPHPKPLLWHC